MRWAVVGGGVLGMRLAQRLAQEGHHVSLYEAADRLGGLASPWQVGDVTWDRHYHVTLLSDRLTNEMYAALGLEDRTTWTVTKTGYYGPDRRLRSVSSAMEFLRLPGLGMAAKVRLGATIWYGSKIRSGRRMERIGLDRWLRRWSGRQAYDTFWLPLLRAKLGDEHTKASAAFIWSTIQRLYAAQRGGLNQEMFGYVHGGYATVCRAFAEWFDAHDVTVRLQDPVQRIERAGSQLAVTTAATTENFDNVVVTLAPALAERMCSGLLPAERRRLQRVEYVGLVCVSLVLRRSLAPYYLTYITDQQTPFTAVVEMTSFIDPQEVAGHALVYLPKYTSRDDELFGLADEEIVARFMPYLLSMYPEMTMDDVIAARVSRVPQVFAIPTIDYSATAPSICTSVPGLYIAGSANLPFSTLNVNDTLSLVDEVLNTAQNS